MSPLFLDLKRSFMQEDIHSLCQLQVFSPVTVVDAVLINVTFVKLLN
jgi:hypothetical protein